MIVSKKEVETPKPPHRVLLELSQEEAGFIYHVMNYYATEHFATVAIAVTTAARCRDKLKEYHGKQQYPYTGYFE